MTSANYCNLFHRILSWSSIPSSYSCLQAHFCLSTLWRFKTKKCLHNETIIFMTLSFPLYLCQLFWKLTCALCSVYMHTDGTCKYTCVHMCRHITYRFKLLHCVFKSVYEVWKVEWFYKGLLVCFETAQNFKHHSALNMCSSHNSPFISQTQIILGMTNILPKS